MTTALYRRYRPETFAEVVGQDHVTAPLRQALRSGQTNHAYLFSGPRGCGKTTSARILARCLNCAQGPTDTPCGVCPSCVELARGGPGSLDVVEIDAASHGGVDDARDLRERATFAPARDRYKVFILDEAHMVSPQGFNALLKIVEEPPEHVKFIFATTEPDKVIGTIRSRTHHYPFRLVPPDVMVGYLEQLCTAEGVTVGSGVLPLVVRAGGGSVRDSLSVLDQLIAGSGPDGLGYEDAVALLGYTHASLLDDLVEAVAARDGASAFRVVERVISTGHEPRRFVEDLLERLRDLIVLAASGDAAAAVLRDVPGDQMARMQTQSRQLGAAELSRSADLTNAALSEMTGATSPRLHLELLMARLLLPALDDSAAGIGARVDRLEREGVRVAPGGAPAPAARPAAVEPAPVAPSVPASPAPAPAVPVERVAVVTPAAAPLPAAAPVAAPDATDVRGDDPAAPTVPGDEPAAEPRPVPSASADRAPDDERVAAAPAQAPAPAPGPVAEPAAHDVPTAEPVAPPEREPGAPGGGDTEMLRRRWPEVLDTLGRMKKTTWVLISQNAQVVELDATTLTLGFGAQGLASAFRGGSHADLVQQAVRETLGFSVKVEGVLAGPDSAAPARASTSGPATSAPARSGTPSAAEATASWDAPAARPAPVPAPTVEAQRAPHTPPVAGGAGVPDAGDDDPEAVADPWSVAVVTGGVTEPVAEAAPSGEPVPSGAPAPSGDQVDAGRTEPAVPEPEPVDPTPDTSVADASVTATDDAAWPEVAVPGRSAPPATPAPAVDDTAWPEVTVPGGASPSGAVALGTVAVDDAPVAPRQPTSSSGAGRASGADAVPDPAGAARDGASDQPAAAGRAPAAARATAAPPWDADPQDPGAPEPPPEDDWASIEPPMPDGPPDDGRGARRPAAGGASSTPGRPAPQTAAPSARPVASAAPGAGAPQPSGADRVRAARAAAAAAGASGGQGTPERNRWADDEPSMDDPDIGANGLSGVPLVVQVLRATVIEELVDEGY